MRCGESMSQREEKNELLSKIFSKQQRVDSLKMVLATISTRVADAGGSEVLSMLVVFTVVLIVVKLVMSYKQQQKLPPGPWGYPLLGHLPLLGQDPMATFAKYRKEYGDVFRIRFGKWPTIVINGKAAIKEALYHHGDAFNDRPEFLSVKLVSDMKGLTFCHFDDRYLMHRKVGASVLKMFVGNGNELIQEIIENEAAHLVDEFQSHHGKPFDPNDALFLAAGSVIYQVVYGKGKNVREDDHFVWFVKNTETFKNFVKAGNPFDVMPWMRFVFPKKFNSFLELLQKSKANRVEQLNEIMKTYDRREMRHACDALISATEQFTNDEKSRVEITDEQILQTTGDFLGAGFDTTATALRWGVLFLADNPEVQLKLQTELDDVVGLNRRPSVLDRPRLPYTEATILEVLRMGSIAPLSLPHSVAEDTELLGYEIPKGTVAFFNIYSSNYDEKLWDTPNEFKPERFLDKDGKVIREKAESVLTFGAGRRRCLGEQLARMEVFMFLTHLLQRCNIKKPQGVVYEIKGEVSLTHAPKQYTIQVSPRE